MEIDQTLTINLEIVPADENDADPAAVHVWYRKSWTLKQGNGWNIGQAMLLRHCSREREARPS